MENNRHMEHVGMNVNPWCVNMNVDYRSILVHFWPCPVVVLGMRQKKEELVLC